MLFKMRELGKKLQKIIAKDGELSVVASEGGVYEACFKVLQKRERNRGGVR